VTEPRLFRVILPVSNIDVAVSFYAEILGVPGDRVSPGRHYFPCGGTILVCYDALADGDPAPVGPNPQHFYFSVDDLEAIHERVRRRSERDVTPIESRPWGERSFYVNDPFGNPIASWTRRRSLLAAAIGPTDNRGLGRASFRNTRAAERLGDTEPPPDEDWEVAPGTRVRCECVTSAANALSSPSRAE
jgi:catechol 2,3-dioxygenase-like lactoylglutathione lyase family enzyme